MFFAHLKFVPCLILIEKRQPGKKIFIYTGDISCYIFEAGDKRQFAYDIISCRQKRKPMNGG